MAESTLSPPASLDHIRAAFDPAGRRREPPLPPERRAGKIYVAGETAHAAGGLRPAPPAHASRPPVLRRPQLLTTAMDTPILQVSCGWRHSALVLEDGSLFVAGENEHGQLGLSAAEVEDSEVAAAPPSAAGRLVTSMTRVPGLLSLRVAHVSCGRSHTAFVCEAGELYAMGLGLYGQLGLGGLDSAAEPARVPHIGGSAVTVSCGDLHTLVLRSDGRALSCGFGDAARLGRSFEEAAASGTCALTLGVLPLHAAAAAASDAFAIVALSAGGAHSAFVTADGSVYTCGRNEHGQLGHGTTGQPTPAHAQQGHAAATAQPDVSDGAADGVLPRRVGALKQHKIRRVALGACHTLFLSSLGTPYACGCGGYGRLGLGTRQNVPTPTRLPALEHLVVVQISAGFAHSSFVTDTGRVYLCGDDGNGQLGLDRAKATSLEPLIPPKFAERDGVVVLGASCGGQHTAFLLRQVVDAHEDYRDDQKEAAASVIEALFRGRHARLLSDSLAQRNAVKRAGIQHTAVQRAAAASVLQAAWRLHLGVLERERREQIRLLRALRAGGDDEHWWGRIQRQFDAASSAKVFSDMAVNAKTLTKASW